MIFLSAECLGFQSECSVCTISSCSAIGFSSWKSASLLDGFAETSNNLGLIFVIVVLGFLYHGAVSLLSYCSSLQPQMDSLRCYHRVTPSPAGTKASMYGGASLLVGGRGEGLIPTLGWG